MKFRVTAMIGKRPYWWDYTAGQDAQTQIDRILTRGICLKSRAGVRTYYPSHRISWVKLRVIPEGGR